MEVAYSSKILEPTHQTTRCHIPEEGKLHSDILPVGLNIIQSSHSMWWTDLLHFSQIFGCRTVLKW